MPRNYIALALGLLLLVLAKADLRAQPGYTANQQVTPYTGKFLPGMNLDYLPPWDNFQLADIAAGNDDLGIPGVGARTTRPGLQDKVLGVYGYDISLDDFAYFEDRGMTELTAIVGFPSDDHRDWGNRFCGEGDKWNALFKGIYEPIWDGGANGTPYDDRNEFAKYMYEVVTRYKDQVRFWEIWNEPGLYKGSDSQVFWGEPDYPGSWWVNDPDPCDYSIHAPIEHFVRTLRIAYEVVKTVAPDDYVVLAGVGSQSFLHAVLRNTDEPTSGAVTAEHPYGGGAYFDVLGFHTYPHIDGSVYFPATGFAARHSDGAADGVINRRLAGYQDVLYSFGYDGATYPAKEHIATEINVPRGSYSPNNLGGEDVQINFMTKAFVQLKINRVHQMHVYSISDKLPVSQINFEFDAMGMYEYLPSTPAYQQRVHEAGKAYKTASDLLTDTEYDPGRTAQLAAPAGMRAYAFRRADGTYVYAAWAETQTDLSEQAFANYAFPTGLIGGDGSMTRYAWDHGYSGATSRVQAGQPIGFDARPSFFVAGTDVTQPNEPPAARLTTTTPSVAAGTAFTVDVRWSEDVTGLTAGDFAVANAQVGALSGSGRTYTLGLTAGQAGPVTVSLPAGAAVDVVGSPSLASSTLSIDVTTGGSGGGGNGGGGGSTDGVDLTLSLTSDRNSVGIYEYITFTAEVRNEGTDATDGVEASLPPPADYVYADQTIGQGTYSSWDGLWRIGRLDAGQVARMEVTLFTLSGDQRTAYAEVVAASGTDADSTPGNGDGMNAREDDEATVDINGANGGGGGGGNGGGGNGGGGGGSTGVDLELALTSPASTYRVYEAVPYRVELSNAGTEAATDVVVDFPFPADFVHTSNAASAGSYDVWLNTWQVGDVPAGATVSLDLTLFPLSAAAEAVAFVQVATQGGPGDADSSPGNGNPAVAREDDEARLVLSPQAGRPGGASRAALQLDDLRLGEIPDAHVLTFTTRDDAQATAQLVDALGRHARSFELTAGGGTHQVELSTAGLPRGMYYLVVTTAGRAQTLPVPVTR